MTIELKSRCLACGVEKEKGQKELYPYTGENDALDTEEPIPSLMTVECEGGKTREFRMAILCHKCWHGICEKRQGIDMWISEECWNSISPITPFSYLPIPLQREKMWNADEYFSEGR